MNNTQTTAALNLYRVTLDARHPPVSIEDLALMLEIEALQGGRSDFRKRLQRALNDAYQQGQAALTRRTVVILHV